MLHYTIDAHLFLQFQFITRRKHRLIYENCFVSFSADLTENSLTLYHNNGKQFCFDSKRLKLITLVWWLMIFIDYCSLESPFVLFLTSFYLMTHTHTHTHTDTLARTLLDEASAHSRDLYLTTHNTHMRQTSMPRQDSNLPSQQLSGQRLTS